MLAGALGLVGLPGLARAVLDAADATAAAPTTAPTPEEQRLEQQLAEVRKKLTGKYKLKLEPPFRCDFRDPWGNRIQVIDLHDESLIWLLPYREVQKTGVKFSEK